MAGRSPIVAVFVLIATTHGYVSEHVRSSERELLLRQIVIKKGRGSVFLVCDVLTVRKRKFQAGDSSNWKRVETMCSS